MYVYSLIVLIAIRVKPKPYLKSNALTSVTAHIDLNHVYSCKSGFIYYKVRPLKLWHWKTTLKYSEVYLMLL